MLSLPEAVHGMVKGNFFAKNMKKRARDNVNQAPAASAPYPFETCYEKVFDKLQLSYQGSTLVNYPLNPPTSPFPGI
jgi:hypothetical protein